MDGLPRNRCCNGACHDERQVYLQPGIQPLKSWQRHCEAKGRTDITIRTGLGTASLNGEARDCRQCCRQTPIVQCHSPSISTLFMTLSMLASLLYGYCPLSRSGARGIGSRRSRRVDNRSRSPAWGHEVPEWPRRRYIAVKIDVYSPESDPHLVVRLIPH